MEEDLVAVVLMPHAPCRVRLILTEATLARLDRATLRALLAHEIAHMQLGHPDARQARADAQKQTEKKVKTASGAASKAASFIPGVGGLVSKGIGTTRKGVTAAMEMQGTPYLPEEEQAADAMAVTLLNEVEASSCRALASLLEERAPRAGRPRVGTVAERASGVRRADRGARRVVSRRGRLVVRLPRMARPPRSLTSAIQFVGRERRARSPWLGPSAAPRTPQWLTVS